MHYAQVRHRYFIMKYDRHVIIIDGVEQSCSISHAITVFPPFVQRYFPLLRKYSPSWTRCQSHRIHVTIIHGVQLAWSIPNLITSSPTWGDVLSCTTINDAINEQPLLVHGIIDYSIVYRLITWHACSSHYIMPILSHWWTSHSKCIINRKHAS